MIWAMYQYSMKHRLELWLGTPSAARQIESRTVFATRIRKPTAAHSAGYGQPRARENSSEHLARTPRLRLLVIESDARGPIRRGATVSTRGRGTHERGTGTHVIASGMNRLKSFETAIRVLFGRLVSAAPHAPPAL